MLYVSQAPKALLPEEGEHRQHPPVVARRAGVRAAPGRRPRLLGEVATVTGRGPRGARSAAVYAAIDPAQAAGGHLTLYAFLGGRK
jgi:hypothetical protein